MQSRSEAYLRTAERAHQQAESALSPQEKNLLLEIERSFRRLAELEEFLVLPEATPNSEPSWFGFTLTVREG